MPRGGARRGGGGGGVTRPGARRGVKASGDVPSESWVSLLEAATTMLTKISEENDEVAEMLAEQIELFEGLKRKRQTHQNRLGILDAITNCVQEYIGVLLMKEETEQEELEYADVYTALYSATMDIVIELNQEAGGDDAAETSKQKEAEKELALGVRLLDTVVSSTLTEAGDYVKTNFSAVLRQLMELMITIVTNTKREYFVREMAGVVIGNTIETQPSLMTADLPLIGAADPSISLVQLLVDACYTLCSDPEDPILDPTLPCSQNFGTQILDTLASSIEEDAKIAPLIVAKSNAWLNEKVGAEGKHGRKAALVCLAVLPEACTEWTNDEANLAPLVATLTKYMNGANETESLVRSAAFICSSEYIEHLQPSIAKYHADTLSLILSTIQNKSEDAFVRDRAVVPLIQLCKFLGDESFAEGPNNVPNVLLQLIADTKADALSSKDAKKCDFLEDLLLCVRSMSTSERSASFAAVAGQFLTHLLELLKVEGEELIGVRGNASAAIGDFAEKLGKSFIAPHLATIAPCLMQNYEVEHYTLRAATHGVWGQIFLELKEDAAEYVAAVVPFICRALAADYGEDEEEEEEEEDEEDEEDEEGDEKAEAVDGERKHAILLYQALVEALGPKFLPHQQRCFEVVSDNAREYSEEVKGHVAQLMAVLPLLYPLEDGALPAAAKTMLSSIKQTLFAYIQYSGDMETVDATMGAFAKILKAYGTLTWEGDAEGEAELQKATLKVLQRKASCQVGGGLMDFGDMEGFEDEEEEEEEEHEHGDDCDDECGGPSETEYSQLDAATLDLIGTWAKSTGPAFESTFKNMWPVLKKTADDANFLGYTYGCLGDVAEALGEAFVPYAKELFPGILTTLNAKQENVNSVRNMSYALGIWFVKCGEKLEEFWIPSFEALSKALTFIETKEDGSAAELDEDEQGAVDNVVSAVGKLLLVGEKSLPLDAAVSTFVKRLPLKNDFEEANSVYSTCIKLVTSYPQSHPGVVEAHYGQILHAFADALLQSEIQEKTKTFILTGVKAILTAKPELKDQEVAQWKDAKKEELEKRLASA